MSDIVRQQDDPLWVGVCFTACLSVVAFAVMALQAGEPALRSSWQPLFLLPLMAVGMARRVRREGGNVTQRAQEVLSRDPTRRPRRYSRGFAGWLVLTYGFCVVVAVASYGLSARVWVFVVAQGALTAYVVVRAFPSVLAPVEGDVVGGE